MIQCCCQNKILSIRENVKAHTRFQKTACKPSSSQNQCVYCLYICFALLTNRHLYLKIKTTISISLVLHNVVFPVHTKSPITPYQDYLLNLSPQQEQIEWAVEEGADFVLAETYGFSGEAMAALECIRKYGNGLPLFYCCGTCMKNYWANPGFHITQL